MQSAEQELAKLEQLLPLNAERTLAEREMQQIDQHFETGRDKYEAALQQWRSALAAVGLPDELTPRVVRAMAVTGANLAGMENQLSDARSDLERRRRELAALSGRIQQVFIATGIQPNGEHTSEHLRQLRKALTVEEAAAQRRDEIRRGVRRMRRKQSTLEERIQRLKRRRQLLFKDCNVADVAAFRRKAAETTRLAALVSERDAAAKEIASLLAGTVAESVVAEVIAGRSDAQLEAKLAQINKQIASEKSQQDRLHQRRNQLSEQLRQLACDRRIATKRFELEQMNEKLRSAVHRWKLLTAVRDLMERVRIDYELNRQPETLRESSIYLTQLTGGRYCRVWTPLNEQVLWIDDQQGRSLPVAALSQGTREQLFLSLRLALVAMFHRRGVILPMILDDVLVNFDFDRAAAAAIVLRDFAAAGHQLLIFTCHEHIARLFKSLKMDVRRLPDNSQPGRDLPFEIDEVLNLTAALPPAAIRAVEIDDEPLPFDDEIAPSPPTEAPRLPVAEPLLEQPATIEVEVQPAIPSSNVDVVFINPPIMPDEPTPASTAEPRISKRRRSRVRIDPPQEVVRAVPIRRRWAAEEFAGELDDRINPLWLLNGDAGSGGVQHTAGDSVTPAIIPFSTVGGRVPVRSVTHFDSNTEPVVIEVNAGDESWDQ